MTNDENIPYCVALILSDTDYPSITADICEAIWSARSFHGRLNREQIARIVKEFVRPLYITSILHRAVRITESEIEGTVKYLQSSIKILFDDEACTDYETVDRDNVSAVLLFESGNVEQY